MTRVLSRLVEAVAFMAFLIPVQSRAQMIDPSALVDANAIARVAKTNLPAGKVPSIEVRGSDLVPEFSVEGFADNAEPILTVPQNPFLSEAPESLQLTATVKDDGNPLPEDAGNPSPDDPHKLRWNWSVVSAPAFSTGVGWSGNPTSGEAFTYPGASNPPGTVFPCNPTAAFDVPGRYVLEFRASDGEKMATQQVIVVVKSTGIYRSLGYQYLSPLPGSEYCSPQTRFVLVRFNDFSPEDLSNLATFITVTGAGSGNQAGQTRIASDGRTVIFQMVGDFPEKKLVTVRLAPELRPGSSGTVQPYQYQFMVSGHLPDGGLITARGDSPPDQTKERAFDNDASTKWFDPIVPDGSAHPSWIQSVYPRDDTHVVNQYAITSASDAPERDPADWQFYGVDGAGDLTLLNTQIDQVFENRMQKRAFTFGNTTAYRGYRLVITKVKEPGTADGVQLAELEFQEPSGSILREYWTGIPGSAVSDLTGDTRYPANPTGRGFLTRFEAPSYWSDDYGARVRGYITAPNTGSFVMWIAGDQSGELWLSLNDDPASKRLIAFFPDWTYSREWNRYSSQQSAPISLIAGQRYYIEAIHKESSGNEYLAVGWAKPGQGTSVPSEVIPESVLSPWTGEQADLATGALKLSLSAVTRVPTPSPSNSAVEVRAEQAAPLPDSPLMPQVLGQTAIMPNGVSVPGDFPRVIVTVNRNPSPGYLFLCNPGQSGWSYIMILDNNGSPVWYRRGSAADFKVQRNGLITWAGATGFDKNFNYVTTFYAANGYSADFHEFDVVEDGRFFLVGSRLQNIDMTRYLPGGNPDTEVNETIIQEFTPLGELVFQWRGWDSYDVRDINARHPQAASFSFPHMNALDLDEDGHILVSCRHLSEVTKINRDTGRIMWRLGGAHSDFTFVNDPLNGFSNQHDISALSNGHYMVFDNGNLRQPTVSRAVEYVLDLEHMTATLVWQFRDTPDKFSDVMGNAQRLPNGNTLINWVYSQIVEVDSNGVKQFEMNLVPISQNYRAFRFPWDGMVEVPYLIVEPYPDNVTLIFNKFGDPSVDHYCIYGGTSPCPTNLLATSKATLVQLNNVVNGVHNFFRVTAVSTNGVESGFSNEEGLMVNIVRPGENMLLNGDFSLNKDSWIWAVSGTSSATWNIVSGASFVDISRPGSQLADIQLRQAGMKLIQGREYVLAFEAWSPAPRTIEVKLAQDQSPWATYKVVNPSLTPTRRSFIYPFVMQNATDLNARLMFNCGASTRDVYLDNVSLWMVTPGDFNRDRCVDYEDLAIFTSQWLQQGAGRPADLNGDGRVDLKDFAIFGENWSGGNCP